METTFRIFGFRGESDRRAVSRLATTIKKHTVRYPADAAREYALIILSPYLIGKKYVYIYLSLSLSNTDFLVLVRRRGTELSRVYPAKKISLCRAHEMNAENENSEVFSPAEREKFSSIN